MTLIVVDPAHGRVKVTHTPGLVAARVQRVDERGARVALVATTALLLGGDEFSLYTLRCGDPETRHGPGLIVTAAESLPHDSPDARWHAHTSVFALVNGSFKVMDIGDLTEPVGAEPPSFQSDETLCGSNLGQ